MLPRMVGVRKGQAPTRASQDPYNRRSYSNMGEDVCSRRAKEGGSVRTAAAMSGRIRREGGETIRQLA